MAAVTRSIVLAGAPGARGPPPRATLSVYSRTLAGRSDHRLQRAWNSSGFLVEVQDCQARLAQQVIAFHAPGVDGRTYDYPDGMAVEPQRMLPQGQRSAGRGDGDDGDLRLQRQHERPLLEGQHGPVHRARALGIDGDDGAPLADLSRGPGEGGDGPLAVVAIDLDIAGEPQVPADEGHLEELPLGGEDEGRVLQRDEEGEDVEHAGVVGEVEEAAFGD